MGPVAIARTGRSAAPSLEIAQRNSAAERASAELTQRLLPRGPNGPALWRTLNLTPGDGDLVTAMARAHALPRLTSETQRVLDELFAEHVGAHHYPWLPVRALIRDRFPVPEHFASSDVPVTVIYGDQDCVVPTELSARVADGLPNLAERVVLEGVDHNDPAMFGDRVADAVVRLAERVP